MVIKVHHYVTVLPYWEYFMDVDESSYKIMTDGHRIVMR